MKKIAIIVMVVLGTITTGFGQITASYKEVVGKTKKGRITTYISKANVKYTVKDTIMLGAPTGDDKFRSITQSGGYPLTGVATNSPVIIKSIRIYNRMILLTTTRPIGHNLGLKIMNLETAIYNKEVQ